MRLSIVLLSYEHGVIRQVIDCLAEVLKRGEVEKFWNLLSESDDFLNQYMDSFHHGKEERYLFPFVKKNLSHDDQVERLVREHERARDLLERMSSALSDRALDEYEEYTDLLVRHTVRHIDFEENILFPDVEEEMPMEEDQSIYGKYEQFLAENFEEGFAEKAERFSHRIQDKVLPPGYFEDVV